MHDLPRIQSSALGANLYQSNPTLKHGELLVDRSSRLVSPFVSAIHVIAPLRGLEISSRLLLLEIDSRF